MLNEISSMKTSSIVLMPKYKKNIKLVLVIIFKLLTLNPHWHTPFEALKSAVLCLSHVIHIKIQIHNHRYPSNTI